MHCRSPAGVQQCDSSGVGEGDGLAGVHRVAGVPDGEAGAFQLLHLGIGDAGAGEGGHGQSACQQVFVELGTAGDGEQCRPVVGRESSFVGRRCCGGGLDGLQGGEHLLGGGVARVGGFLQLVHGAVDAYEEGTVDRELTARETVEQLEVEGDADLGVGQGAVPVDQLGVWLVEGAAVAVGPQGVDVVAVTASRRWSSCVTARRVGVGAG